MVSMQQHDIWKDFHARFHKSNVPRLYKLRQQIHSFRQGSMDLSSYHIQTQSLWEELSSFQITIRTVEGLLAERETNRVIDFLMGLNDSYDTIRRQILMKKSLPTLSEVYNLLDQEDCQRSARMSVPNLVDASAFQISQPQNHGYSKSGQVNQNAPGTQSYGYQRKDIPVCTFCGGIGNIMDRCYKKYGYPTSFKSKQKFNRNSSPVIANVAVGDSQTDNGDKLAEYLSSDQIQQIVSILSSKLQSPSLTTNPEVHSVTVSSDPSSSTTICPISGNFYPSIICSFTGIDRPYICSVNSKPLAINACVIDSGATNHISHDKHSFSTFRFLPNTTVSLPNEVLVSIVGIGTIDLGKDLVLEDVLYIPQFKFNLLSVSCLTKSMGCIIWFDANSCGLRDLTRGLTIGTGRKVANLYFLDIEFVISQGTSSPIIFANVSSHYLGHKRLGHPSVSKLQSINQILSFQKQKQTVDFNCKVCHLAKQKHIPFVSNRNLSETPFDLLHIDTWGLFSSPTHDGYRFFLTIVDYCSRAT